MDPMMPGYTEDQIHMADYDGDQFRGGGDGPSQWGSDQQQSQWGSDQQQSQWSSGNQGPASFGGGPPPLSFGPPPSSSGSGCVRLFVFGLVMLMMFSAATVIYFSKDLAQLFESSSNSSTERSSSRTRTSRPDSTNDEEEQNDNEDERSSRKPEAAKIRLSSYSVQFARDLTGDEAPELVSTRFDSDSAMLVVMLDGATGSLLWEQPIEGRDTGLPLVQQIGDMIVAVRDRDVTVFEAKSGEQAWSAKLPDSLSHDGVAMAPAKPTVVALHSSDNSLTGFDLKTGKQRWQITLKETSYKRFQQLGDHACTEGRDETDELEELHCYDLASGELSKKLPLGQWHDDKAWWPDLHAEEPTLYHFKGQTFATMELAQVRLADGSEVWSQSLGEDFAVPRIEDMPLVQDGTRVAFGAEGHIGIIVDGGAPVVASQEEAARIPLGFDGDLLYVAAIKQRGTQTISLQGLDAATGEVRWQTDPLATADPRFGDEGPAWKIVPGVGLIFGWNDGDNDVMHMTLFDAKGQEIWDHEQQLFISETPTIWGTNNLVYGLGSSTLVALNPKSGALIWRIGD